jgi:hypothetical protein
MIINPQENDFFKKANIFFYNNEYSILELAGIVCGLLIIAIANKYFAASNIYFIVFISGIFVGGLGFLIEYYIKTEKRKSVETEFNYFLYDLSKEYKKTRNLSLALSNLSEYNFYGNINPEIKRLSNRVSWGESFEESLYSINKNINSSVIEHTLIIIDVLKKSTIDYDKILENVSKDLLLFRSESKNKIYFSNLFYLSVLFYFIFIFVLLYIDHIIGSNFLWYSTEEIITRTFFDNFILYIALLLGGFTSYVMYIIKKDRGLNFIKYVFILFVVTIVLFQTFIPKPDAEEVIIDTMEYMIKNNKTEVEMRHIIALKTISSKYILESTRINISFIDSNCLTDCKTYTILVNEPAFYDFKITKQQDNEFVIIFGLSK